MYFSLAGKVFVVGGGGFGIIEGETLLFAANSIIAGNKKSNSNST